MLKFSHFMTLYSLQQYFHQIFIYFSLLLINEFHCVLNFIFIIYIEWLEKILDPYVPVALYKAQNNLYILKII